jgi:hypothetical protein
MLKKLLLVFVVAGMAVLSAKTFSVTLYQPSLLGNTELKPGDYKLELKDQTVVIRSGKISGEAPVKVETNGEKYSSTTVRYRTAEGKNQIQEIRLGGTNMKLVVND